jgi:hypothetical protein
MKHFVWNRSKNYGVQIQDKDHQILDKNYDKKITNHA